MGQEIENSHFQQADFDAFMQRLREETALLARYFTEDRFNNHPPVAGFELEAWLVDEHMQPAPINKVFLERLNSPLVSPELATFNVEFNVDPATLTGNALSTLETELQTGWQAGCHTAQELNADLAMIGILPTVHNTDLVMENLSAMNRYVALNAQVLRLRGGRPLKLDIRGLGTDPDILRATRRRDAGVRHHLFPDSSAGAACAGGARLQCLYYRFRAAGGDQRQFTVPVWS